MAIITNEDSTPKKTTQTKTSVVSQKPKSVTKSPIVGYDDTELRKKVEDLSEKLDKLISAIRRNQKLDL